MKRSVENALYLIGGIVVGSVGGFFITTKLMAEKIRKEAMAPIEDMEDYRVKAAVAAKDSEISKLKKEIETLKESEKKLDGPKDPPKTVVKSSLGDPSISTANPNVDSSKYHSIISEHVNLEGLNGAAKTVVDEEEEIVEAVKHITQDYPYILSSEGFNDYGDDDYRCDYQHVQLDYFKKDNVLCVSGTVGRNEKIEEMGNYTEWEIIKNPDEVIGTTWKRYIGCMETVNHDYLNWADDTAYVRNDILRCDFEIEVQDDSYKEYVIDGGRK